MQIYVNVLLFIIDTTIDIYVLLVYYSYREISLLQNILTW